MDVNGMEEADFLMNYIRRTLMKFLKIKKIKKTLINMAGVLMWNSIKVVNDLRAGTPAIFIGRSGVRDYYKCAGPSLKFRIHL